MIETIDEAYLREQFTGGGFGWAGINPGNAGREGDVLQCRQFRHQLIILKDKADATAKRLPRRHHPAPVSKDTDRAGIGFIESAQLLKERGLTRARRSPNRDGLTRTYLDRDIHEHGQAPCRCDESLGEATSLEDDVRHRA